MNQTEKFEKVLKAFSPQSRLLEIRPLKGGLSTEMSALEYEDTLGQSHKIIVRQHNPNQQQAAQNEFHLLQQLNKANRPTPKPFHLDLSCTILPNPYLIIEFIEGEMLLAPTNLENHILQSANQLAAIHTINIPQSDLTYLPLKTNTCIELDRTKNKFNQALQEK